MSIKLKINIDQSLIKKVSKAAAKKGLWSACDHLAAVSKEQVPLDKGPLKNSCSVSIDDDGTTAAVSYDTPYAIVQHECEWFNHPNGRKAKYLENPVNDSGVQNGMMLLLQRAFKEELQ